MLGSFISAPADAAIYNYHSGTCVAIGPHHAITANHNDPGGTGGNVTGYGNTYTVTAGNSWQIPQSIFTANPGGTAPDLRIIQINETFPSWHEMGEMATLGLTDGSAILIGGGGYWDGVDYGAVAPTTWNTTDANNGLGRTLKWSNGALSANATNYGGNYRQVGQWAYTYNSGSGKGVVVTGDSGCGAFKDAGSTRVLFGIFIGGQNTSPITDATQEPAGILLLDNPVITYIRKTYLGTYPRDKVVLQGTYAATASAQGTSGAAWSNLSRVTSAGVAPTYPIAAGSSASAQLLTGTVATRRAVTVDLGVWKDSLGNTPSLSNPIDRLVMTLLWTYKESGLGTPGLLWTNAVTFMNAIAGTSFLLIQQATAVANPNDASPVTSATTSLYNGTPQISDGQGLAFDLWRDVLVMDSANTFLMDHFKTNAATWAARLERITRNGAGSVGDIEDILFGATKLVVYERISYNQPGTPSGTGAATTSPAQTTSGLVLSINGSDDTRIVNYFKITGISGGTLYQNDGVTPIALNAFITYAQGHAGLKFTPMGGNGSVSFKASVDSDGSALSASAATAVVTVTADPLSSYARGRLGFGDGIGVPRLRNF